MAKRETPPGPRITWVQAFIAVSVVAVASLASLVIVASLNDSEALTTVALALAIVTFIIQIVVFIAQTWTTSQLNAETRGFLEELKASAHGTERALNTQVDKLTDHLLQSFETARKREDGSSGVELRQRLREDVFDALSASQDPSAAAPDLSGVGPSPDDQRVVKELLTMPDEQEGLKLVETMSGLPPLTVACLRSYAEDELRSRQLGNEPGLEVAKDHPFSQEAINAGLLEYVPVGMAPSGLWARLTEQGRQLARLMLGNGIPDWLRPV